MTRLRCGDTNLLIDDCYLELDTFQKLNVEEMIRCNPYSLIECNCPYIKSKSKYNFIEVVVHQTYEIVYFNLKSGQFEEEGQEELLNHIANIVEISGFSSLRLRQMDFPSEEVKDKIASELLKRGVKKVSIGLKKYA